MRRENRTLRERVVAEKQQSREPKTLPFVALFLFLIAILIVFAVSYISMPLVPPYA